MWCSGVGANRRNPRLVIHSMVTRWEADEGDVKLYGTARAVTDPDHRAALYQAITQAHGWPKPPPDDPATPPPGP
jgi:hypothetical protein